MTVSNNYIQRIENCFVKTVIEFKVYYINCQVFAFQEVVSETCLSLCIYSLTRNQLAYSGQEWAFVCPCVFVCTHVRKDLILVCKQLTIYSMSHGSALTELCWISECTCYYYIFVSCRGFLSHWTHSKVWGRVAWCEISHELGDLVYIM